MTRVSGKRVLRMLKRGFTVAAVIYWLDGTEVIMKG